MAKQLIQERNLGSASKFNAYLNMLPSPGDLTLPLQLIKEVNLSNEIFEEAVELTEVWRDRVFEDPEVLQMLKDSSTSIDRAALSWALDIVQTRYFAIDFENIFDLFVRMHFCKFRNCKCTIFETWFLKGKSEHINLLAPYFDLLNHGDEAQTTFYVHDGHLCLDTNNHYDIGDEVCLCL